MSKPVTACAHTLQPHQQLIHTGSQMISQLLSRMREWKRAVRVMDFFLDLLSFNSSFINEYLLSSYCVPGTVLDIGIKAVNKRSPRIFSLLPPLLRSPGANPLTASSMVSQFTCPPSLFQMQTEGACEHLS